jgi:hypothetical protein
VPRPISLYLLIDAIAYDISVFVASKDCSFGQVPAITITKSFYLPSALIVFVTHLYCIVPFAK